MSPTLVIISITLVSVLIIGAATILKLRTMHEHFNRRLDGLARGIDAVREVANMVISSAAAVHGGRDSRADPRKPSTPSSAERHD